MSGTEKVPQTTCATKILPKGGAVRAILFCFGVLFWPPKMGFDREAPFPLFNCNKTPKTAKKQNSAEAKAGVLDPPPRKYRE